MVYLLLKKALYDCTQLAILWYNTFKNCLERIGFKTNNYNLCVANMDVNGKQCTEATDDHLAWLHPWDTKERLQDAIDAARNRIGSRETVGSKITTVSDVAGFEPPSASVTVITNVKRFCEGIGRDAPSKVIIQTESEYVEIELMPFTKKLIACVATEDVTGVLDDMGKAKTDAMKKYQQHVESQGQERKSYFLEALSTLEEIQLLVQKVQTDIKKEMEGCSSTLSMASVVSSATKGGGAAE